MTPRVPVSDEVRAEQIRGVISDIAQYHAALGVAIRALDRMIDADPMSPTGFIGVAALQNIERILSATPPKDTP